MVNDDSRFQEYELAVVILFFKEHFITVNTGTTGRDVYVVLFELCRLHFRQLYVWCRTLRCVTESQKVLLSLIHRQIQTDSPPRSVGEITKKEYSARTI
jgi:hypothetical protein